MSASGFCLTCITQLICDIFVGTIKVWVPSAGAAGLDAALHSIFTHCFSTQHPPLSKLLQQANHWHWLHLLSILATKKRCSRTDATSMYHHSFPSKDICNLVVPVPDTVPSHALLCCPIFHNTTFFQG